MPAQVIYYGTGALPATTTFNSPADIPAMFVLSGTATTQNNAACMTGIAMSLDGEAIGNPALCWANQNNNHTAMRPTYIPVNLTFGEHQIEIYNANSSTVTDVNDVIQVVLLY